MFRHFCRIFFVDISVFKNMKRRRINFTQCTITKRHNSKATYRLKNKFSRISCLYALEEILKNLLIIEKIV